MITVLIIAKITVSIETVLFIKLLNNQIQNMAGSRGVYIK
jgi:hypothetical protein